MLIIGDNSGNERKVVKNDKARRIATKLLHIQYLVKLHHQ